MDRLSRGAKEPDWLSALRQAALAQHEQLPWPSSSDDIWRRTDASLLNPRNGFAAVEANGLFKRLPLSDEQAATLIQPMGAETVLVHADGEWISRDAPAGVTLTELSQLQGLDAERVRQALAGDGLTPEEQKFTTLNTAFHRQGLVIDIADGVQSDVPMRLVRLASARPNTALFPLTVIRVGKGSRVTLIHEDVGLAIGEAGAQVITGRIELVLEPEAQVQYCRVQRWQPQAREFLLQRATLEAGAKLTMTNINFGAAVSKTHVIAKLQGQGAESRVFGFVFGHHQQHVDFHSLQDHLAPHTMSDLSYKAALKDDSRMIYTGLIRIAKAAKQTDAYQSNHNLLLSQRAKAETIPMLEILADDVQCKHGATIGPVDEEQLFYLMSRAIPRPLAERLLVLGFVEPIIAEVPFEPLQQRLRQELEESLV